MTRTELIQLLIDKYDLKSYVEIGTQRAANNFDKIRCVWKCSVDPDKNSDAFCKMTSDEYFSYDRLDPKTIDIFFIDGFHEREQVTRDINNALRELSTNGFIVVHDCNPVNELVQRVPRESKQWTGDVWKSILDLRDREDLRMYVVDTDWGCAVIQKGNNGFKWINGKPELTYENLDKNRREWLNLVSVDYFKAMHSKIVRS